MGTLIEKENRYYKECNVVMLPTEDKTDIVYNNSLDILFTTSHKNFSDYSVQNNKHLSYQHLYFTSDEEPIDGDWSISLNTGYSGEHLLFAAKNIKYHKTCRKIIATTDDKLFDKDYIIPLTNLPQIPQQFIKEYVEAGGIDKALVEHKAFREGERPSAFVTKWNIKTDSHNTIIIKPVKNNFNLEELINILHKCQKDILENKLKGKIISTNDWVKQNL